MKVVILAGGFGTRISEESALKPKPMILIGGKPILWHIMKIYSYWGLNEFIVCCGYKGYLIKEYFANYKIHNSDVTFDLKKSSIEFHSKTEESWKITLVDTGEGTMTGGRLKRIKEYLNDETFCCTYGDGLSDINIVNLINYHKKNKKLATLTAVQPPGRFGILELGKANIVNSFKEKPLGDGYWVNGGFFVLEPKVLDRVDNDMVVWEESPLQSLANDNQLIAYKHKNFWCPMDTLRDKNFLENLWQNKKAPWKVWD
tara:strand:+ start:406 stop:1179 length:774 start_codon:yes stop_codon:yes gene_type:complete